MTTLPSKLNKAYETDASQLKGIASSVIIPENLNELQEAVKKNSKITIRGAGTGLVGGAVPFADIVIDMSKFNKIENLNKIRRTVDVGAGVVLDDLNKLIEQDNLEFPVNPSSHEVCTIGGMIATNAVGSRAIKYGRTSNWIEWLDILDANGKIQRKFKAETTDYTGLEGISGIIVKAGLKLTEKKERTASLIEKDSIRDLIEKVKELKRNSNISMIELYDKYVSKMLSLPEKYHLLVEFESNEGDLSRNKYEELLAIRDKTYPLLAKAGFSIIEDPKLFLDKILELTIWLENNKIPYFGHISVGIIHPCFSSKDKTKIPEMMKIVKRLSGQITGEHGIGIIKKQFVDEQDKSLIRLIKKRTNPQNKFNSGKVVD